MLHEMGVETGVDLDKMIALATRLREWVGHDTESSILSAGPNSRLVALNSARKQR